MQLISNPLCPNKWLSLKVSQKQLFGVCFTVSSEVPTKMNTDKKIE